MNSPKAVQPFPVGFIVGADSPLKIVLSLESSQMFKKKTVFVIGAGASAEFGFPTGPELQSTISDMFNPSSPITPGDINIAFAQTKSIDYGTLVIASQQLSIGLHGASSIDRFLAMHNDDGLSWVGKLAISYEILKCEIACNLAAKNYSLKETIDTWLGILLKILQEQASAGDAASIFHNVSFVTFNYDRVIEQFFYLAIQRLFRVQDHEVINALRSLRVFRAYGKIGQPPFMPQTPDEVAIPFGSQVTGDMLIHAASNIKTIGDEMKEVGHRESIRDEMRSADQIIFLGFSFNEQNVELIAPPGDAYPREVFFTAYRESPQNVALFREILNELAPTWRVNPVPDKTSAEFLQAFGRLLAR
jgi:hypothetical protein